MHKCTTARWKILIFLLAPVVEQTHLILTWSETSKTGYRYAIVPCKIA